MRASNEGLTLSFRACSVADLPELVDLWVESWTEVYPVINFNDRRGWFRDHINRWLSQAGLCQLACSSQTSAIAGFMLLKPDTGHLDQFCVSQSLKGSGVAHSLMQEARRLSPQGLHLDVNAMNHRAIRFYEREGFARTGDGINPVSGLPIIYYRWQP